MRTAPHKIVAPDAAVGATLPRLAPRCARPVATDLVDDRFGRANPVFDQPLCAGHPRAAAAAELHIVAAIRKQTRCERGGGLRHVARLVGALQLNRERKLGGPDLVRVRDDHVHADLRRVRIVLNLVVDIERTMYLRK